MSPAQTVFAAATVKLRASSFGAMGRAWLLLVVTTRKRRLPRVRMSASQVAPGACPREHLAASVAATREAIHRLRAPRHRPRESLSAKPSRSDGAVGVSSFRRARCRRYPDALTLRTWHWTHTGQSSLFFSIQAYFIAASSQSTPWLFPECRAPWSPAPAPPADGCSPSAPRSSARC